MAEISVLAIIVGAYLLVGAAVAAAFCLMTAGQGLAYHEVIGGVALAWFLWPLYVVRAGIVLVLMTPQEREDFWRRR